MQGLGIRTHPFATLDPHPSAHTLAILRFYDLSEIGKLLPATTHAQPRSLAIVLPAVDFRFLTPCVLASGSSLWPKDSPIVAVVSTPFFVCPEPRGLQPFVVTIVEFFVANSSPSSQFFNGPLVYGLSDPFVF